MTDAFTAATVHARRLAEEAVCDVLETFDGAARVEVCDPEAPLAPFATVRMADGALVAGASR